MSENSSKQAWVIFVEDVTLNQGIDEPQETIVYEIAHSPFVIHALVLTDLTFCQALEGNQFIEVTNDPIYDQFRTDHGLVLPLYRFSKPLLRGAQNFERYIERVVEWMPNHALWIW
jgi:hypothetical protein